MPSATSPARPATTPNNYLFAGEQFDPALGVYYNRARYYDQRQGRFWTMDTEEGDPQSPGSLHKYLYCRANPVSGIDPTGHEDIGSLMAGLEVGAILLTIAVPAYSPMVTRTKVEVHFDEIPAFRRAHHAYLLVSSGFGLTLVFRGGPSGGDGNGLSGLGSDLSHSVPNAHDMGYGYITSAGSDQPFRPGAADYPKEQGDDVAHMTLQEIPQDFQKVVGDFKKAAQTIDGLRLPYHPITQNSNSFAHTLLVKANIATPDPPVWSPGWGHILY